jgi:hypothetical protein
MAKSLAQVLWLALGPFGPPGQDWCGRHSQTESSSDQIRPRSTRISTITNTNPKPPLGP